jgi:hypothetical protein
MGGGDDNQDPMSDLRLETAQKKDPATEARQLHLWNQAQQYAGTSPFSSQYGGAAAMPGMGAMSQRGQQYLTNQILGPGAYGAGCSDSFDNSDRTDLWGCARLVG